MSEKKKSSGIGLGTIIWIILMVLYFTNTIAVPIFGWTNAVNGWAAGVFGTLLFVMILEAGFWLFIIVILAVLAILS